MAQGYAIDEPSDTTPLSPRVSDVSSYMRDNDFLHSPPRSPSVWSEGAKRTAWSGKVRHAVGIGLLLATVFLWTASNFLASVSIPNLAGRGKGKIWRKWG
jgi:solute carrier family 35 protein F5